MLQKRVCGWLVKHRDSTHRGVLSVNACYQQLSSARAALAMRSPNGTPLGHSPNMRNQFFHRLFVVAVLVLLLVCPAHPCSWAVGYFQQLTCLRGTIVGMNRGWPRWLRQRVVRANVNARLYEYRWPLHDRREMPLVKTVQTDKRGWFDFGELPKGHYTLVLTGQLNIQNGLT